MPRGYSTFSLTTKHADRLRKLAALEGSPAATLLSAWIDDAAESAGLELVGSDVRVERRTGPRGTFLVSLFSGGFTFELSLGGVENFVKSLEKFATCDGLMFDMDDDFTIENRERGVIVTVPHAISRASNRPLPMKKTMSRDEAVEIAKAVREGLAKLAA